MYVRLAAVLRVSQGGGVPVGVPPLTSTSGRQRLTNLSRPRRRIIASFKVIQKHVPFVITVCTQGKLGNETGY